MSNPVVELISQDIQTAINAITTGNGFNQTLVCVRPTRTGFEGNTTPEDGKVVLIQEDPDENEELSSQGNVSMKAWNQQYLLVAFVIASDKATTPIDTRINQVRADIEKKLMEDDQRSTLAINTEMKGSAKFDEGAKMSGIAILIEVMYRTRENDPYTKA